MHPAMHVTGPLHRIATTRAGRFVTLHLVGLVPRTVP